MADADRWWTGRIADPDVLSEMRSLDFDTYDSDGLRNLIYSDIYDFRRSRTLTFANALNDPLGNVF